MNDTLVSVIVPIYNAENYLNACLNSIVNQSYNNIEIILVNDGSTDLSDNICQEYAKKDGRIKYIFQQNKGVSNARNTGIEISNGEYLIFVDSDDFLPLDAVELLIDCAFKHKVDAVIGKFLYVDKNKYISNKRKFLSNDKNQFIDFITENYMWAPWGKLIKKEKIKKLFDKDVHVFEDYLFWASNKQIKSYCYINEIVYFYRKVDSSIMNTKIVTEKTFSEFEALQRAIEITDERCQNMIKKYFIDRLFSINLKYNDKYEILKHNKRNLKKQCGIYIRDVISCKEFIFKEKIETIIKYLYLKFVF